MRCRPVYIARMHPAVFLDRDDTLIANRSLDTPDGARAGDLADPDRVVLLPGALEACRLLRRAAFRLIVFTNQGVVARGGATPSQVDAVHDRLRELLVDEEGQPLLDDILYCPYHPEGSVPEFTREHPWRKPAPGMILHAAEVHDLDLTRSWVVGDQQRDIDAGVRAAIAPQRCLQIGRDVPDLLAGAIHIVRANAPTARTSASIRLSDPTLRADTPLCETVESSARALAERVGVRLLDLAWRDGRLEIEVDGPQIVAIGLAAELRRTTDAWYRARAGRALWHEDRP